MIQGRLPASPAVRELVPRFGTDRGVPAGVPAARLLRRDPRSASPPGGHGPVRHAWRTQYRRHGDQGRPCPRQMRAFRAERRCI